MVRLYTRWLYLSQNRLLDVTNLRLFLSVYILVNLTTLLEIFTVISRNNTQKKFITLH